MVITGKCPFLSYFKQWHCPFCRLQIGWGKLAAFDGPNQFGFLVLGTILAFPWHHFYHFLCCILLRRAAILRCSHECWRASWTGRVCSAPWHLECHPRIASASTPHEYLSTRPLPAAWLQYYPVQSTAASTTAYYDWISYSYEYHHSLTNYSNSSCNFCPLLFINWNYKYIIN